MLYTSLEHRNLRMILSLHNCHNSSVQLPQRTAACREMPGDTVQFMLFMHWVVVSWHLPSCNPT